MSAAGRYGDGCLPVVFLAGLILTLGSAAAWPAMGGGQMGVHLGGSGAVGHMSTGPRMGVPHSGFRASRFVGRRSGALRFVHGGRGRRGFFPYSYYGYGYPYDDGYGYGYEEQEQHNPRGSPHSGYCDVSSHSFPQFCVWKEGP